MKRLSFTILMTLLFSIYLFPLSAPAGAQATPVYEISQQEELGGELYQTVFLLEQMRTIGLTRDQIVGIDFSGKSETLIEFMPGQRANLSPGGRFVGVMTIESEFIKLFELKAFDGKVAAVIEPSDGFVSFIVGRDAQMIVGASVRKRPEGVEPTTFHFYNSSGEEMATTKASNPTGVLIAPDGKAFVLNDSQEGLKAFSQDGSMLWQADEPYRFFDVSYGAQQAVGNSAHDINRIVLFVNGAPLDVNYFKNPVRNVAISPNGSFVAATDAQTIKLFDIQSSTFKSVWEFSIDDVGVTINSIDVSNNGMLACGLLQDMGQQVPEMRYQGQVFLFDYSGGVIWQQEYDLGLSNAWIPIVALDTLMMEQMVLTVRTRETLFLYTVP